jgi:hypothetical protein
MVVALVDERRRRERIRRRAGRDEGCCCHTAVESVFGETIEFGWRAH